jgi:hypothetical protein
MFHFGGTRSYMNHVCHQYEAGFTIALAWRPEAGCVCCNPATVARLNAFPVLGEKSKGIVKLGKYGPGREFWS